MKNRAIELQLIKPVKPGTPGAKGKIQLKQLFKEQLAELQVPTYDPCCDEAPPTNTVVDPSAAQTSQSKYLLSESSDVFSFNGPKMRNIHNTPETLLWKKADTQLTNNFGVTKSGAVASGTISVVDHNDQIVVGAGTTTSYWRPNKQFASRRFVVRMKVRVDALGTTPILGLGSVWPGSPYNSFNNTIYWGYANLLTGATTFSTQTNVDTKVSNNSFTGAVVVGDIITVEYICNYMEERIFRVIKNDGVLGEITSRRDTKAHASDTLLQNHHHIGFFMGDGTYTILDATIHTKEPLYPKVMFVGDSISTGIRVTPANTPWGQMSNKIPYNVSLVGGTSMQQRGALEVLHEILTIKPEYAVLFLWIDPIYLDKANPVSVDYATWTADFNRFVAVLKAHGIKVIFPYPQNWAVLDPDGGSSTFYADYLNTNYASDLKLYIPTSQAFYDSTAFHYNATTYNWITDQLITLIENDGGF